MGDNTIIVIFAGLSSFAAIANLIIAIAVSRIARKNAIGSVFIWSANLLSSEEAVQACREVFIKLGMQPEDKRTLGHLDDSLRENLEHVCRTYDLVGIASHNNLLPRKVIAKEWGNSIIQLHEICKTIYR